MVNDDGGWGTVYIMVNSEQHTKTWVELVDGTMPWAVGTLPTPRIPDDWQDTSTLNLIPPDGRRGKRT